jgi:nucleotide-binding universal stress UspA family protein
MTGSTIGRPVVAGVDGSASALHAALWAADVAARGHRPLRLLFASDDYAFGFAGGSAPPQSYFDQMRAAGEQLLAVAETEVRRRHPDLEIAVDLQSTGPVQALVEQTEHARILVLGSRGKGGFRGLLTTPSGRRSRRTRRRCWPSGWPAGRRSTPTSSCGACSSGAGRSSACSSRPSTPS